MTKPFRRAHSLAPNKATSLPWQAIFVDTETKPVFLPDGRTELVFKLGWAAYWRRNDRNQKRKVQWYDIPSPEAFWEWVEDHIRTKSKLYLFAFNLFFDFSILKGQKALLDRGWKPGYPYYSGQTAIHRWRKGKKTIVCLDVGNFFPGNLKQLGDSLGLEKGEVDFETVDNATLSEYCHRDVEIILKGMLSYFDFIKQHDLGGFRVTAPAQAMAAFRHRFMDHRIWLTDNTDVVKMERAAYHGGRVTMFFQGQLTNGPFYKLDYNSAYPAVYGHYRYPANLLSVRSGMSLQSLAKRLIYSCVIAEVDLITDEPVYPVLRKGKLYFPIGKFSTILTTRELSYALHKGHLKRIHQIATYHRAKLFKRFVNEFYALRCKYQEDGNKAFEIMVKQMLNGISGKWGQHQIKRTVLGTADPYIMRKEKVIIHQTRQRASLITYGGKCYLETKEGEAYNAFPAIIAHITADLRMRLWQDMQIAGLEHCYYCDTDSLFVDAIGLKNLRPFIHPTGLGYLKIEDIAQKMSINAPKDYVFGDIIKRKGVPKRARQLNKNTFQYDQFQGWHGAMNRDEVGRIITRPLTKTLYHEIRKGKLDHTGRVLPLTFPDDIYTIIEPYQAKGEKEAMQEALSWIPKIPQSVMLAVWDYNKGEYRRARDFSGNMVLLVYSKWDEKCTELGFANVDDFMEAVRQQVQRG